MDSPKKHTVFRDVTNDPRRNDAKKKGTLKKKFAFKSNSTHNTPEKRVKSSESNHTAQLPAARMGHSAVYHNSRTWIFGGKTEDSNRNDLFAYSHKKKQWIEMTPQSSHKSAVPARRSHVSVVYNNKLYVFGGLANTKCLSDMREYDFETESWTQVKGQSGASPETYLPSAVVYGDSMYVLGGKSMKKVTQYQASMWRYHFESKTWTEIPAKLGKTFPTQRWGHSAVIYKNSMIVFGGQTTNELLLNELFQFNFETNEWSRIMNAPGNPPPSPRYAHCATMKGDSMYIFGGSSKEGRMQDLHRYNFETSKWSVVASTSNISSEDLPEKRSFASMISKKKSLYLFGGSGPRGMDNSLWKYDTVSEKWRRLSEKQSEGVNAMNTLTSFSIYRLEEMAGKSISAPSTPNAPLTKSEKIELPVVVPKSPYAVLDHLITEIDQMVNETKSPKNEKKRPIEDISSDEILPIADQVAKLEREYVRLKTENENLRRENQELRNRLI